MVSCLRELVAMDAQRLGSSTAAFDLHFQLELSFAFRERGQLTRNLALFYLKRVCKAGRASPEMAQILVRKLDSRWDVKGVTSALLQTARYSSDVAVFEEYAGSLPAHLAVFSKQADPMFR